MQMHEEHVHCGHVQALASMLLALEHDAALNHIMHAAAAVPAHQHG